MKATARLLVGTTIALFTLFTATIACPQQAARSQIEGLIEAHEAVLGAVQAERTKLKVGKSGFFNVIGLAKDLRNVELRIANGAVERIAVLNRFRSLLLDLEAEVKTPLDRKMLDAEKTKVEADLKIAKRDAVQIEQINQQQRSLRMQQRNLWRRDLDGSPLVQPTLPPKLAEKNRR